MDFSPFDPTPAIFCAIIFCTTFLYCILNYHSLKMSTIQFGSDVPQAKQKLARNN